MWSPSRTTSEAPRRRRELTLAGQFLALQLVVVAALLLIVGVLSVRQSTSAFTDSQGAQMRSVAEDVANRGVVRCQLSDVDGLKSCDPVDAPTERVLAPEVASSLNLSSATSVQVVSPTGEVLASTDPSEISTAAALGDSDVLAGRGWVGDVEVDGERAIAGHAPVLDDRGRLVGAVLAEQTYPTIGDRLSAVASDLVLFLGVGAALGIAGSVGVSRIVRRRTRGLAPTDFAGLADHREALLHSIREGVVAVGTDGRVTMMNDAAKATLEVAGDPVGRDLADLGIDPHVVALLAGSGSGPGEGAGSGEVQDAVVLVGTRVVVVNRRLASSRGRGIGSVTTLRDRTELLSLRSRLTSNLSITDTLRAQTHEFDNHLHTISGLVQLEEYDEVRALVGDITRHRSEAADFVGARIADPAVAALVLAKKSVADERGVDLDLDPGSQLPVLPRDLSGDLATVVGNLIDNAVDACAAVERAGDAGDAGGGWVELWVTHLDDTVHLRVRDNGPGIPVDLREAIFTRGFSTKPEVLGGRGIGLPLVQLICARRGGRVEVGAALEEGGAEFVVRLPVHEGPRPAATGQDGAS